MANEAEYGPASQPGKANYSNLGAQQGGFTQPVELHMMFVFLKIDAADLDDTTVDVPVVSALDGLAFDPFPSFYTVNGLPRPMYAMDALGRERANDAPAAVGIYNPLDAHAFTDPIAGFSGVLSANLGIYSTGAAPSVVRNRASSTFLRIWDGTDGWDLRPPGDAITIISRRTLQFQWEKIASGLDVEAYLRIWGKRDPADPLPLQRGKEV